MGLDDEGFLSKEAENAIELIRGKHKRHFELLWRVNKYFQNLKYRLSVFSKDGQQVISTCLMIKLLNDIQGAVLLLERGLGSQARSLIRVGVEALIVLGNVCNSAEFFQIYVYAGEKERLKLMRAIKKSTSPALEDVKAHITEEMIDEVSKEITEANVKKERIEEWATQAKLEGLYDGAYRLFSQDIHSTPRAIECYLETDEAGEPTTFSGGPETEKDFGAELIAVIMLMLEGMEYINHLFGLNIKDELEKFRSELVSVNVP